MNTEQMNTWKEIVQQCKSRAFNSINVASETRSDAILAVDALVELVTEETAALLEQFARVMDETGIASGVPSVTDEIERAYALAARIREALVLEADDGKD